MTEDHTLVGPQSVLWDVGGALVEWDLYAAERTVFLQAIRERSVPTNGRELLLHEMAYAAFRLGMCALFACHEPPDSAERRRLEAAAGFYSDRLRARIADLPRRQAQRALPE